MVGREKGVIVLPHITLGPIRLPRLRASGAKRIVLPRVAQVKSFALSRSRMPKAVIALVVLIFLIAGMNNCAYNRKLAIATRDSRMNAHMIQLAVERYSTDSPNGSYPLSLKQIIGTGYLPEMPRNCFSGILTRWPTLGTPRPMRALMLGEYCPGDVLYIPRYDYDPKEVSSYSIIVVMGNGNPAYAGNPLGITLDQPVASYDRMAEIDEAYRRGPLPR